MKILVVAHSPSEQVRSEIDSFVSLLKKEHEIFIFDEEKNLNEAELHKLVDGVELIYFVSHDKIAIEINKIANQKQIAIVSFFNETKKHQYKKLWKNFYHYSDAIHYLDYNIKADFEAKVGPTNNYIIQLDESQRIAKMLLEAKDVRDYKIKNNLHHRIIYYKNPLVDDFAGTRIDTKQVPDNYVYVHKGIFYRFWSWFIYYVIALPLVRILLKIKRHVTVKNPEVLKKLRKKGFFVYGNHTAMFDALNPQAMVVKHKRCYIIANPDATSIKGVKTLVNMLGVIPLPNNIVTNNNFLDAIRYRYQQNNAIIIYPEAHIWPFYTGVRPFSDVSFRYPAELNAPVITMVTTYRKSKSKKRRPYMDITLSEPIYPNPDFSLKENMKYLRDQVYDFMKKITSSVPDVGYINYVQAPPTSAKFE